MFDSIQGNRLDIMKRLASLMVSLAVHAAALCVFVLLPLAFLNALPQDELLTLIYAPPLPPVSPPPPPPPRTSRALVQHVIQEGKGFNFPDAIPKGIPAPTEEEPATIDVGDLVSGTTVSTGPGDGIGGFIGTLTDREPTVLPPLRKPEHHRPIVVVSHVQAAKLILRVDPTYPDLARKARISGTVILEALVDEEGNVSEVKLLKGHPLLNEAAIQAVKQWKYSPTVLNGEPVPIIATVTVVFSLNK